MVIERINSEEFEAVPRPRKGLSPLVAALRELTIGDALKTPCTWRHMGKNVCAGVVVAGHGARRVGMKVRTRCYQKMIYVLRVK